MNMMTAIKREEVEEAADIAGYIPRNIEGRLREWSRARWYAPVNPWPSESGVHAVLHNPGRATAVKSDGGMAALCDRSGRSIALEIRVLAVNEAIAAMPSQLSQFIRYIYDVPQRERPKSERSCAEKFGISRDECGRVLARAYGWLERELDIVCPLEVILRQRND